jgi:hypothetical protein
MMEGFAWKLGKGTLKRIESSSMRGGIQRNKNSIRLVRVTQIKAAC